MAGLAPRKRFPVRAIAFLALWLAAGVGARAGWVQLGGSLNTDVNQNGDHIALATLNGTPYAAIAETNGVVEQVRVRFFDGGQWQPLGAALNVNAGASASYPGLTFCSGTPYVTWQESSPYHVYVKHYAGGWVQDGGALNLNACENANGCGVAMRSGTPYAVWRETDGLGVYQIHVGHFLGGTWLADGGSLNMNAAHAASGERILMIANTPFVFWHEDNGSGVNQAFGKYFTGSAWVDAVGGSLNLDANEDCKWPNPITAGGTPFVSWKEATGSSVQVYVKYFNGAQWVLTGPSLNVDSAAQGYNPLLTVTGTTPFEVWHEVGGPLPYEVRVKYYQAGSWVAEAPGLNYNTYLTGLSASAALDANAIYVGWPETDALGVSQLIVHRWTAGGLPTPYAPLISGPGFIVRHALVRPGRGERASFEFILAQPGHAAVAVYDLVGNKVAQVADADDPAGDRLLFWDGGGAGSGTYLVSFTTGTQRARGKVVVVR